MAKRKSAHTGYSGPKINHLTSAGMHNSVGVPPPTASFFRQYLAYAGPALLVSVGYMDPGNWATDLQGGAHYKYGLMWVLATASFMAMVLQIISARLGVATGKDLAQACRSWYPEWSRWPNWIAAELAIIATDMAECLGSAVAIKLLFGIPLFYAVLITAFDVLLLLMLQSFGMRTIEAVILVLVVTITGCYYVELFILPQTKPDFFEVAASLVNPEISKPGMLFTAIGIIGATVMPHNLYLHSALVQSRRFQADEVSVRTAIRFNTIDSIISLFIAFLVNAAIMILAAVVFYGKESVMLPHGEIVYFSSESDWIQIAHLTLAPLMGSALAGTVFAIALLASGQSSTITGTLAGQIVMEGFMKIRIRPWIRRIVTRCIAILPAVVLIGLHGEQGVTELLTLSQVILGIQLPFAMIPLMRFTSSKKHMGKWVNGWFLKTVGWMSCIFITGLVIYGLPDSIRSAWRIVFH